MRTGGISRSSSILFSKQRFSMACKPWGAISLCCLHVGITRCPTIDGGRKIRGSWRGHLVSKVFCRLHVHPVRALLYLSQISFFLFVFVHVERFNVRTRQGRGTREHMEGRGRGMERRRKEEKRKGKRARVRKSKSSYLFLYLSASINPSELLDVV